MVTYHPKVQLSAGYAGLAFTARQIAEYIPKCEIYCEPFAGLGRVAKHVHAESKILNDKSEYAYQYLRKHFPQALVRNLDFEHCISAYDSTGTTFLVDPPWRDAIYSGNEKYYIDRKPVEYYTRLLEILPKIQGDWL